MILTDVIGVTAYRMHTPKWAVSPTSGDGAARQGGRLNRPGVPALYLALDAPTAIKEYQQLSPLLAPGTLVSYLLNISTVADFRGGWQFGDWSPIWQDFFCDWRASWFGEQIEPPSWAISDAVIDAKVKGILFPSQVNPGGFNLALYLDMLSAADDLAVVDPGNALPKNQDSWK